jgi:hypothetical protein
MGSDGGKTVCCNSIRATREVWSKALKVSCNVVDGATAAVNVESNDERFQSDEAEYGNRPDMADAIDGCERDAAEGDPRKFRRDSMVRDKLVSRPLRCAAGMCGGTVLKRSAVDNKFAPVATRDIGDGSGLTGIAPGGAARESTGARVGGAGGGSGGTTFEVVCKLRG